MSTDLRCFRLRIVNANELCFFEFVVFADVVGVLKKENCFHDAWLILGLREEKWETIRPRGAAIHYLRECQGKTRMTAEGDPKALCG